MPARAPNTEKMLYSGPLACRAQDDALQGLASRDKAPERDEQLACQRDNHRLARAGSAVGSAGPVPLCQCAVLLKPQKAPGELDHAAADPGIAGSGEALFPPPRTALVRRARQTGVARHRFAVTHWSREHLMDEHISRFKADADDPSHLPDHGVRPGFSLLLQSFLTSLLNLSDLADDKAQPCHIPLQLGQGVWRQRNALWGVHCCKTLRCLPQGGFEIAHAEPGQRGLHSFDDARAFPDQALALPVRPLGVLFGNCRDARHAAMAPFPAQPPQEPALQQLGVEPVGLGPAMLPRYGDTRGMDHVRFDPARIQPTRQPEAIAAGFEGQCNPRDLFTGPDRFIAPAMQQAKKPFRTRFQLLLRLALNAGKHPGNQPARLAQLDDGNDCAILVQGDEGPAQSLPQRRPGSFSWGIGALRQLFASDDGAISSPPAPYHLSAGGRWIRTIGTRQKETALV